MLLFAAKRGFVDRYDFEVRLLACLICGIGAKPNMVFAPARIIGKHRMHLSDSDSLHLTGT